MPRSPGWSPPSSDLPLTPLDVLVGRLRATKPVQAGHEPALRWAAVAIVLVPDPDAFLLIRRAERRGDPWSGHLALPGGRRDPADADLLATAIRETREEVGVALEHGHLVGTLDDVVPRTPVLPPIAVRPFVFRLPGRPAVVPNPEVAAAEWIDLALLATPHAHRDIGLDLGGEQRRVPAWITPIGDIWGMTERIVSLLLLR